MNDVMRSVLRSRMQWSLAHALPRAMVRTAARRGDLQAQLIARGATGAAVWDLVEGMRAAGPLYRGRVTLVTVDHAVARQVLTSPDFQSIDTSTAFGPVGRLAARMAPEVMHPLRPPSLLVTEPPDHTRFRKLVSRVFTARAVADLRVRTEQIAAQLLDKLSGTDPVDLVEAYCSQLPVTVIAELLGVPPEERQRVLTLGNLAAPSLDFGLSWQQFRSVQEGLLGFDSWLSAHLERLRREPGDDLLSQLIADGGLDDRELRATAGLVLVAGFETTVNLLGNGIALLHDNPDQLEALRASPQLWANATDEVLRLDPPVLLTGRQCARDTMVGDALVQADSRVVTILGGANRDPQVFEKPGDFDVSRANARDHLSFSAGRHFCLGASLARMEGEVGLRAIFDRYPNLARLPGARRRETRILRGFQSLPARLV